MEPPLAPFAPSRTAVVLIEYQNDFASDGSALRDAVEHIMESTGMLANTRRLADAARCGRHDCARADLYVPGYRDLALHP